MVVDTKWRFAAPSGYTALVNGYKKYLHALWIGPDTIVLTFMYIFSECRETEIRTVVELLTPGFDL